MTSPRSIHLAGRYYRAYPPDAPLGYTEDALELNLDETVFLLVDVYGRGFDPGDDLGSAAEFYKRSVLANRSIVVERIAPSQSGRPSGRAAHCLPQQLPLAGHERAQRVAPDVAAHGGHRRPGGVARTE
jgi:hypothetical protein